MDAELRQRDLRWAWRYIAVAIGALVVACVVLSLPASPAWAIGASIGAFAVVYVAAIVWSSRVITRHSEVSGDFVLFAGGFNIIFAWAPIVGLVMNLVAGVKLMRGIIAGGTITTTSGSSVSVNSMSDKTVGELARPLGVACLIAALLQPLVVAFIVRDALAASADEPAPLAPAPTEVHEAPAERPGDLPAEAPAR
jgi:hypothetical protein